MKISDSGIALIKHFEGCKLKAYLCPAGVWTIGYGHTDGVKAGMAWTQQQADDALARDLQSFESAVSACVTVPITQSQFDALVSFAFNCGAGALRKSTLLRLLNAGDYSGAEKQFGRWISKGTAAEKGLRRRRKAEALLFSGGDWTSYEPSA